MMALEAPRLGIQMNFLDPGGTSCPSAQIVPHANIIEGGLKDGDKIRELAKDADVVTVEIEHVGVETLEELEKDGVNVQPSGRVLKIIRDKDSGESVGANSPRPAPLRKISSSHC